MKQLILIGAILMMAFVVNYAVGENAGDRPAGVSADRWVKVSDTVGIVLTPQEIGRVGTNGVGLMPSPPPANGFFMVRTPGGWRRLVVADPLMGPGGTG
jgi:hypothetical protein